MVILNTSASELRARLRLFPAVPLGDRSEQWPATPLEVTVGPYSRLTIDPAATAAQIAPELATFAEVFVATEVRLDGPGGAVMQQAASGEAADISPCATGTSSTWYFATGSTRRDARLRLSLLNPYADDTVADLAFATDEGLREPVALPGPRGAGQRAGGAGPRQRGHPAPAGVVLGGRTQRNLLAFALQTFNGDLGLAGLSLRAGAPGAAEQWLFPLGVAGAGTGAANSFVVHNPGDAEARVDLAVEVDASLESRGVPPFELTVAPGRRVEVTFFPPPAGEAHPVSELDVVTATTRVLPSERYWVSVRSFNGVAVVAERLRTAGTGAPGEVSILAGRAVGATGGLLPLAPSAGPPGTVAIVNPSAETISHLSLEALTGRGWAALPGLRDVEIRPRQRLVLDVSDLLEPETLALRFEASEPLVASYAGPGGIRAVEAIPEAGTASELDPLFR